MSLMPAFSPHTSAYRFDNLTADGSRATSLRSLYSIAFQPDGLRYFLTHEDSFNIERYTPSTAWNITTSPQTTSIALSTSISGVGAQLGRGIEFNGDGTKVFVGIGGAVATDYIEEHALSTAYGGTATYTTRLAFPTSNLYGFTFASGGTKIIAHSNGVFYDVSLSTAYDLSTAGSWSLALLDLSGTYTNLRGFCFGKTDGQLVMCEVFSNGGTDLLHEYRLSTPGAISTATFVRTQDVGERNIDVTFGDGGRKLFGSASSSVRQYSTVG